MASNPRTSAAFYLALRKHRRPMPPPAPSTRLPPTVVAVLGLLLSQLPAAASQDACTRPCGREHTCGELNASFSCGALSGLGCDCSDCCLDSLSPHPPPAQPPPPPSLPPPPSPLFPPLPPGGLAANSATELRDIIASSAAGSRVVRLSGRYALGSSPLYVSGVDLTLEGFGTDGATLDAQGMSRAIEVADGASLTLRDIHVVNGRANSGSGGGLLIHGAGSSLLMERGSVRDSVATGESDSDGGGGLQHAQKSRPLRPRAPAFDVQPGPRVRDRSDGQGAPCAPASRA